MDKEILEYRTKHPKCKWCRYWYCVSPIYLDIYYEECILKDKILSKFNLLDEAKFCKYYKTNEGE